MRDEYNFVAALQREQLLSLRELVLQLVLATDMRHHFEHTALITVTPTMAYVTA